MTDIKATSTLPNRIVTLYTNDSGPLDFGGGTRCPHCGAEGRYVHYFLCNDGKIHAAMSGCIKLFPHKPTTMSKMAELALGKQQDIFDENRKSSGSVPRKLASWFQITVDTLEKLRNEAISMSEADRIICEQYNRRHNWLNNNGYGKFRK